MKITDYTRDTLQGIPGLFVVVESIKADAEADGLHAAAIQKHVEALLTEAGITVLQHEDWRNAEGRPWLYVSINTIKHLLCYFFAVDVQLKQDALLARRPSIATSSATWEVGSVGYVTVNDLPDGIRNYVAGYIGEFIEDYKAVNDIVEEKATH